MEEGHLQEGKDKERTHRMNNIIDWQPDLWTAQGIYDDSGADWSAAKKGATKTSGQTREASTTTTAATMSTTGGPMRKAADGRAITETRGRDAGIEAVPSTST